MSGDWDFYEYYFTPADWNKQKRSWIAFYFELYESDMTSNTQWNNCGACMDLGSDGLLSAGDTGVGFCGQEDKYTYYKGKYCNGCDEMKFDYD